MTANLLDLVRDPASDLATIAAHLDGLDDATRLAETRIFDRDAQRHLYDRAAAAPPLTLDFFGGAPGVEIVHDGLNTLPLPAPIRRFEKRFSRPADGTERLFGFNFGPTRKLVGPGYFVAQPTDAAWALRGGVVIDYFQVPDGPVPAGWPAVVPNRDGLSRFVYFETRDFMRRVSAHVSIGCAYKRERTLDHYFVLCRRPLPWT